MTNTISFDFTLLDMTWDSVTLRDLWAHKDLGVFKGR